jgi:hypothetical protein
MELLEIKNFKKCTRCKIVKKRTKEFFPLHNKVKDGLDSWCRKCRSTYRNEINRGRFRESISDENLKKLKLKKINCEICDSKENLVIDHNHKTNVVRGVLCSHCNLGLGHFLDNKNNLEKAVNYLKKTEGFNKKYWGNYFNKQLKKENG